MTNLTRILDQFKEITEALEGIAVDFVQRDERIAVRLPIISLNFEKYDALWMVWSLDTRHNYDLNFIDTSPHFPKHPHISKHDGDDLFCTGTCCISAAGKLQVIRRLKDGNYRAALITGISLCSQWNPNSCWATIAGHEKCGCGNWIVSRHTYEAGSVRDGRLCVTKKGQCIACDTFLCEECCVETAGGDWGCRNCTKEVILEGSEGDSDTIVFAFNDDEVFRCSSCLEANINPHLDSKGNPLCGGCVYICYKCETATSRDEFNLDLNYCNTCAKELESCVSCDRKRSRMYEIGGEWFCRNCSLICSACSRRYPTGLHGSSHPICPSCIEKGCFMCRVCGIVDRQTDGCIAYDGTTVLCSTCVVHRPYSVCHNPDHPTTTRRVLPHRYFTKDTRTKNRLSKVCNICKGDMF